MQEIIKQYKQHIYVEPYYDGYSKNPRKVVLTREQAIEAGNTIAKAVQDVTQGQHMEKSHFSFEMAYPIRFSLEWDGDEHVLLDGEPHYKLGIIPHSRIRLRELLNGMSDGKDHVHIDKAKGILQAIEEHRARLRNNESAWFPSLIIHTPLARQEEAPIESPINV